MALGMRFHPRFDVLGFLHVQVVEDRQDLAARVLAESFEKTEERRASMAFFTTMKRSKPVLLIAKRKLADFRCECIGRTGVRPFDARPRPGGWPPQGALPSAAIRRSATALVSGRQQQHKLSDQLA